MQEVMGSKSQRQNLVKYPHLIFLLFGKVFIENKVPGLWQNTQEEVRELGPGPGQCISRHPPTESHWCCHSGDAVTTAPAGDGKARLPSWSRATRQGVKL